LAKKKQKRGGGKNKPTQKPQKKPTKKNTPQNKKLGWGGVGGGRGWGETHPRGYSTGYGFWDKKKKPLYIGLGGWAGGPPAFWNPTQNKPNALKKNNKPPKKPTSFLFGWWGLFGGGGVRENFIFRFFGLQKG